MNTITAGTLAVTAGILFLASSIARADADLEILKSVDNATPPAGSGFEFTVDVNNSGPDTATGIEVRDALPPRLMLTLGMSPFVSQGSYDPATGLWRAGSLSATDSATLIIPAIETDSMTPGCVANTATIEAADQDDPDASNNESYAIVLTSGATVCARLVITAIPDIVMGTECGSEKSVLRDIFFDFELRNEGPSVANDVTVTLSGSPPRLAPGILQQPTEVEIVSIGVGETVRDSVGWRLGCGAPATTATYQIEVTSVTLLASNSIIRIEGEVDIPGTGTCDCTVDIGVAGCFIATAAYGSPLAKEVEVLRNFRDNHLQTNPTGRRLVNWYYRVSPPLAAYIADRPVLRAATRLALTPIVYALRFPWWTALLMLLAGLSIPIWRVWRDLGQRPG